MQRVTDAEKENERLRQDIQGYKKIQSFQGRALDKMVNQNNYPDKIKGLVDELKYQKDKIRDLDESLKKEQRMSHQQQYHNSLLLEQIRDLKSKLNSRQSTIMTKYSHVSSGVDIGQSKNALHQRSQSVLDGGGKSSMVDSVDNESQNPQVQSLLKEKQILQKSKETTVRKHVQKELIL